MLKESLRRYILDATTLHRHRGLRPFSRVLGHPSLWHLNRRSTSLGFSIGMFMNFVPIPFPMILAVGIAARLRANIPATVVAALIRNAFTISLFALVSYQLGTWALGVPIREISFEISWEWLTQELARGWKPFLVGCLIGGVASALLSYCAIQLLWRWHVVRAWRRRASIRSNSTPQQNNGGEIPAISPGDR